jgi:hyperosmotically inducible protein
LIKRKEVRVMKPNGKRSPWVAGCVVVLMGLILLSSCRTPAGRTAGEVVDDDTIKIKVKAKLFDENILRGFAISVEVFQGQVTLTGAVDNEQQRERAEAVAKSVYGVKKVNNLLSIKQK